VTEIITVAYIGFGLHRNQKNGCISDFTMVILCFPRSEGYYHYPHTQPDLLHWFSSSSFNHGCISDSHILRDPSFIFSGRTSCLDLKFRFQKTTSAEWRSKAAHFSTRKLLAGYFNESFWASWNGLPWLFEV